MDSIGEPKMFYSRAGLTPLSLFGVFMNLSWYESNGAVPVPWMKRWVWLPRDLQKEGYYTVFITANPMMKLYQYRFNEFNEYINLSGCMYHADEIVNKIIQIYQEVDNSKYIFALLMETHQPYPYKKNHTQEYLNANYRPITRQVKALETIDKDFGRLKRFLKGTNTDVLCFSDHGDLDKKIEGYQGHGPAKFHDKLFEIPYIRGTL